MPLSFWLKITLFITVLFLPLSINADEWPSADQAQSESIVRALVNADLVSISVHLGDPRPEGGFILTHGPDKKECGYIKVVLVSELPQLEEIRISPPVNAETRVSSFEALAQRIQGYYLGYQDWDKPMKMASSERTDLWVARMARFKREDGKLVHDGFVIQFTCGYRNLNDQEIQPCDLYAIKVTSRPEDKIPAK